jgi:hypothetical protein
MCRRAWNSLNNSIETIDGGAPSGGNDADRRRILENHQPLAAAGQCRFILRWQQRRPNTRAA